MKSKLIIILILLIILFTSNGVFAENFNAKIVVNSESIVKLKPDTANLTFSIITNNKNQSEALNENNIISNRVLQSLESIKINKDNIVFSNVYIEPIYNYEKTPEVIVSYKAVNTITISTTQLESLSKIISVALESGATSLYSINYTSTDFNTSYYKALNLAIKDSKLKAESIRKTLNLESIKPILIEETSKNHVAIKESNFDTQATNKEIFSTPIFIDDLDIYASVKIEFVY